MQQSSNKFLRFHSYHVCHSVGYCFSSYRHNFLYSVFWDVGTRTLQIIFFLCQLVPLWDFPIGAIGIETGGRGPFFFLLASCGFPVCILEFPISLWFLYITLATVPFHSSSWIQLTVFPTLFKPVTTQIRNSYSCLFVNPQQLNLSTKPVVLA